MMRLTEKARELFAVGFMAGIGTVGVQDVDADGSTDFTVRGSCRATIGVYREVRRLLGGSVSLAPLAPPDDEPAPVEVAHDADLSGQVFVFTGFRDEVLAARIENAGGTVAGGSSRKVTTLLVADPDAKPTGKVKKAIEYCIAIRSRESFEQDFYIAQ